MPETSATYTSFSLAVAAKTSAPRWHVAFSGGLDSTVLLHLAMTWCQAHPEAPQLLAWHINHGMLADADAWEIHCDAICRKWQIPFKSARVEVQHGGDGVEAAARVARYNVFEQGLGEGEVLLLAHHLDDQVETFLLRLLRGAGLSGMSGMPTERSLGPGVLLRPLLDRSRRQLEAYAIEHQLAYICDPSNNDVSLDRNYLRRDILPLLEQRWPGYRQTMSRASDHVASALTVLEDNLPEPVTVYSTLGDPGVPLQVLTSGSRDVAVIRLRSWLRSQGLPMPNNAVMGEFVRQLREGLKNTAPRLNCGHYALERFGDAVYLPPRPWDRVEEKNVTLAHGDDLVLPGVGVLSLVPASSGGVALAQGEVLEISWRQGGERCRPQGRAHSQTLKKLLQERSVPTWWRERIPLASIGGELLAVGDLWLCESSRLRQIGDTDLPLWQLLWKRNTFTQVD